MLVVPIGLTHWQWAALKNLFCERARHAVVHATPLAALELHFEMLQLFLNQLPVGAGVLKPHLPQHVVKKHTSLGKGGQQAWQVLQGVLRVAMQRGALGFECGAMAPLEQETRQGIDVEGVYARKLSQPLAGHHPAGAGANQQQTGLAFNAFRLEGLGVLHQPLLDGE